jgi:hypothetical protein
MNAHLGFHDTRGRGARAEYSSFYLHSTDGFAFP